MIQQGAATGNRAIHLYLDSVPSTLSGISRTDESMNENGKKRSCRRKNRLKSGLNVNDLSETSVTTMEQNPVASTSSVMINEPPPVTFKDLGIEPFLIKALAVMSIRAPTGVQAACIPPVLAGKSHPTPVVVSSLRWILWVRLQNCTLSFQVHIDCARADTRRDDVQIGADCIGSAQTGSGKTIAFAIPILQALAKDPYGLFALVLTPTR